MNDAKIDYEHEHRFAEHEHGSRSVDRSGTLMNKHPSIRQSLVSLATIGKHERYWLRP